MSNTEWMSAPADAVIVDPPTFWIILWDGTTPDLGCLWGDEASARAFADSRRRPYEVRELTVCFGTPHGGWDAVGNG